MAIGKRREERTRVYELATMVWAITGDKLNESDLHEFIRCGSFMDPATKRLPYNPLVEEKMKEFEANGGRLII